jgi:hypothetical protein
LHDLTPGSPGNADGNPENFLASSASVSIPTLSELAQIVLVALRGIYTLLAFLTLVAACRLLWLSRIRRVA